MTEQREALDLEAMRALGKPYSECHSEEKQAVEFAVNAHRVIDLMNAAGASTLGELIEKRREVGK